MRRREAVPIPQDGAGRRDGRETHYSCNTHPVGRQGARVAGRRREEKREFGGGVNPHGERGAIRDVGGEEGIANGGPGHAAPADGGGEACRIRYCRARRKRATPLASIMCSTARVSNLGRAGARCGWSLGVLLRARCSPAASQRFGQPCKGLPSPILAPMMSSGRRVGATYGAVE